MESAGARSAVDGESGDDADEGSDDGGERAYQEAATSATDQLAKSDPELADMVKKIDARGKDLTYRMAHGRGVGEESSSDDDTGAARALAQGGAKSLQLGDKQHTRLSRRLSQHEQASAPRQVPISADVAPPTPPTPAISRSTPAADDELTLGGPTVATPTLARIGPHAALSGIAQRATTLALGGVRSLVGRSDDGSPAESFVDVGGAESSRSLDRHDCSGRGFPTPTVVVGGGAPVVTPPAPERARAELDLELTMPFFNDPVIQATAVNGWGPQWGSPQAGGVRGVVPSLPGASPPPAGMHDTRAGVESGGLADGGEVSLQQRQVRASEIRAAAAVKANEIQLSKIRNDDDKLEKDSDKYDSNDFKILRMIVNDFSASYTPPVAHDPKPSADTRTLTSKWVETVTDRVKDPIIRAREYDIMFVPTRRIIKLTARVRFGREGLHPDMFRAYSWTNTRTMAPLTHDKSKLEAKLQASDLASELHDYSERSEQMVHWVRQTLSKNFADRLEAFFAWGETKLKKDKEGLWTLTDWKTLLLDVLDRCSRHLDIQLDTVKGLCAGSADEDTFAPTLARARQIAMTRLPSGFYPIVVAWAPLVLEDVLDTSGGVHIESIVIKLREEQLSKSLYDRNRESTLAREKESLRQLHQSLLTSKTKSTSSSATKAGARARGSPTGDDDGVTSGPSDDEAEGEPLTEDAAAARIGRAVSNSNSAKARRRKRDQAATKAGNWIAHDLALVKGKEPWEDGGILVGPFVRATGPPGMIGTRLMEDGERKGLADKENKIVIDGDKVVCLKSTTNDDCPLGDDCWRAHCDPKRFKNGLPDPLRDEKSVAKLSKALRIFGVAHGGFKCVKHIDVSDRKKMIEKIRASAQGGGLAGPGPEAGNILSPLERHQLRGPPSPGSPQFYNHYDDAGQLPPAPVYEEAVVTSGHEGEQPLRELITGSKPSIVDLRVPAPVRPFGGPSDDTADARAAVARGEAWRSHVLSRVEADDASDDAVVMWAARVMDRIATGEVEFDGSAAAIDRLFELAMAEGVGRGSRVLSAFCARYARRTVEQAAVAASGHRSVTGMPLLMVHEVSSGGPVLGDYSLQVVELCGAVFHALDAGSVVAGHPDQCVLVHHSLLDLLYDGVAITEAMVADRGRAIARAFTAQAKEALAALGTAPESLTVREAELYHDIKDIVEWNDHDARLSVHVGHGLPSELVFSNRPWEAMRLVVVACVGPGHSVRVYVITGEDFRSDAPGCWTAWLLVYKNHAVAMRLADSTFVGERGASQFLNTLPCSGISPVAMTARSWRAVVTARGGGSEPRLPAAVLRGAIAFDDGDPFRARGPPLASEVRRAKSFEAVENSLPPVIDRWCRRFMTARYARPQGAAVDASAIGGAVSPPALPFGGHGPDVAAGGDSENRGGGVSTAQLRSSRRTVARTRARMGVAADRSPSQLAPDRPRRPATRPPSARVRALVANPYDPRVCDTVTARFDDACEAQLNCCATRFRATAPTGSASAASDRRQSYI